MGSTDGIVSSDTSMQFTDTKVEVNLANAELGGSFGGVVGASFASGEDLVRFIDWFRLDDQKRNAGPDITTPLGSFEGHLGCTAEVCLFAFEPSELARLLSSVVLSVTVREENAPLPP